jgi:hypothetical protein
MVRLKRDTRRQLEEVRESMRVAEELGQVELEKDDRDRVSLDQVIRRLIAFRARHADRRRRSSARRRQAKRVAAASADASPEAETLENRPENAGGASGQGADGGTIGMLEKPGSDSTGKRHN